MEISLIVPKLKEYLDAQDEILAVYLFGSHAEGCARPDSDQDIAILLQPAVDPQRYSDYHLHLLDELSYFFPQRLDLIILNQAPPLLQFQVLQKGQRLFDRNPDTRAELEMHMLNRYYDLRPYYEFHFGHLMEKIKRRGLGHGHTRDPSQTQKT
ncbi:nucleotidyltransferase domain-containing protein [Candidatus Acetothermia bacterium]|nr:nucleotidyltransferase domain-containing protein [Candidatus Acetothermia bacterium]